MGRPDLEDLESRPSLTPEEAADIRREIESLSDRVAGQSTRLRRLIRLLSGKPVAAKAQ